MGLLDFIGNAAVTANGMYARQNEAEEKSALQEERDRRQAETASQLMQKRTEELEKFKEQQRIQTQQRLEQEMQAAEKGGQEIRSAREVATANKVAPSVDKDTLGLIRSSLSDAEVEKYYGVKKPTAVGMLDDQIEAARGAGHLDTVKALREDRKAAFNTQKEEDTVARNERNATRLENRDEQRHQEAMAKLARFNNGTSTGSENKELLSYLGETRKKLASDENALLKTMKAEQDAEVSPAKKKEIAAAYAPQLQAIRDQSELLSQDYAQVRKKLGLSAAPEATKKDDKATDDVGKSPVPPAVSSVKGAPSGSSIGVLVSGKGWEVKDAKGKVIGYAKE